MCRRPPRRCPRKRTLGQGRSCRRRRHHRADGPHPHSTARHRRAERDQPYGDMATAALKYAVGRSVLRGDRHRRYGRAVATLYHSRDGYDINASMVCAGYAWWYGQYAPVTVAELGRRVKRQKPGKMQARWLLGSGGDGEMLVIIATLVASSFTSTLLPIQHQI